MKQISLVNKWVYCIALATLSFGIAGSALAQSGMSSESKKQQTGNNKKDPSNTRSAGDNVPVNGSGARNRDGTSAGNDKSLGSSALGSANIKPGAGSGSSLGGSTDQGFSNNKKDQSNSEARGDQDGTSGKNLGGTK
jgi:hypothetical protein